MNHRLFRFTPLLALVLLLGFSIPAGFVLAEDCPVWVPAQGYAALGEVVTQTENSVTANAVTTVPPNGGYYTGVTTGNSNVCREIHDLDNFPGTFWAYIPCGEDWTNESNMVSAAIGVFNANSVFASFTSPFTVTFNFVDTGCTGPDGPGPGGGLTFPLKGEDAHEQWGTYDLQYVQDNDLGLPDGYEISEYPNTVYAFSNDPEAKVSAVADGEVISVTNYTGRDCSGAFVVLQSLRKCRVFVPQFITQETKGFVFDIELINISLVVVEDAEDPDITYTYWLTDAEVQVGNEVVAGCLLGKTIQLKNISIGAIEGFSFGISGDLGSSGSAGIGINGGASVNFRSLLVDAGITTVVAKVEGEPVPLYPLLSEEPDQDNCATASLTNCIVDNPELSPTRNGLAIDDWSTGSATPIDGGGVHIQNGGSIVQFNIAIDPGISYTMSVLARVTTPIDSFYPLRLEVGSASTTVNITEGDYQLKTWALGPREVSVLDHIGVFNQTSSPFNAEFPVEVDVKYICFAPVTANVGPGACYFANHEFTADGQGWISSGNVQFSNGQVTMGDAAVIEQSVMLLPDGDTPINYTVSALVRLNATSEFTGQVGKEIQLVYRFPESESYLEVGKIDSVLVTTEGKNTYDGNVNIEHVYRLSHTFEISGGADGLFSFGVLVTDPNYYLRGLRIDQLCITPDTPDGSFPGHPGDGGFQPPFIERCGVIPTPIDNNISSWTYFHWKNLERFFDCDLMVLMNKMASAMDSMFKTTKLFMRWSVVLVNRTGDWVTTLLWWLNGHFRNIAVGRVTTIYESGGGTCSDLFCVLESLITGVLTPVTDIVNTLLSLLTTTANLLFTVVTGVLGLGLSFLIRLFNIFNQATGLLSGLIDAYNTATPVAIEGMPTCTVDPNSSMFCRMVWVMDNTAFSGRWGILFTVAMAILTIHLILWTIGELRRAIVSSSASTA